ncbi:Uncharacterised protein [Mycobacteroides abscessus]|nr:hypothetical protein MMAS_20420 [Mycobacteroides abscessus subsp. massiliense CCUG 48898 = JCM 15300]CPU44690.1 Uncharacterised protein [Mycobacteroides abscessus]
MSVSGRPITGSAVLITGAASGMGEGHCPDFSPRTEHLSQ